MIVLCIDTRSRELEAFTASLTQATAGGLVLRVAARVGGLSDLLAAHNGRLRAEFPLVVLTGGYSAQSSAGFTSVLGAERLPTVKVVGGTGFGYEKYLEPGGNRRVGDGLRRFKAPLEAVLLPSDCAVELLATHANSNSSTADAAVAGLRLLAECGSIVIAEGQSDRTVGYLIKVPPRPDRGCYGQFDWLAGPGGMEIPPEHRAEVFSEETAAVDGGLRALMVRLVVATDDQRAIWTAARLLATTLIRADTTPSELVEVETKIGRNRLIDVLAFPSSTADLSVELSREGLGRDALLVLKTSWGGDQTQAEVVRLELGRDAADALAEALSALAEEAGPAASAVTVGRRRGRRRSVVSSVEETPGEELGEA